jgi:two-component system CheB/CheR fusion protein
MRVQPYRTLENVIEGAVLTLADVTEQRRLQGERDALAVGVAEAGDLAQAVLDTGREPTIVLDEGLTIVTVNKAFLVVFGITADAIVGRDARDLEGAVQASHLFDLLPKVLLLHEAIEDYELNFTSQKLGPCTVTLDAVELARSTGRRRLILLTATDVKRDA